MFNKNSSAGTAAKNRSKCSLFERLPLLLAILMLSAVFSCQAQTIDFKTDTTLFKDYHYYPLMIMDSSKRVAYLDKDSNLVVIDSLATIKVLIQCSFQNGRQLNKYQERFYAAADILNYLKINGTISNKKKFDAAVKKYRALMSNSR
jgi:hypothetical protein